MLVGCDGGGTLEELQGCSPSLYKCWLKNCWQYIWYVFYPIFLVWWTAAALRWMQHSLMLCSTDSDKWQPERDQEMIIDCILWRSSIQSDSKDNMKSVLTAFTAYCKIIAEHCQSYWYERRQFSRADLPIHSPFILQLPFCTARKWSVAKYTCWICEAMSSEVPSGKLS